MVKDLRLIKKKIDYGTAVICLVTTDIIYRQCNRKQRAVSVKREINILLPGTHQGTALLLDVEFPTGVSND